MPSVYVVSTGSDWTILAVFSSAELAEAYLQECRTQAPDSKYNPVEAFPLDAPREDLPGTWTIVIDDVGTVVREAKWSESSSRTSGPQVGKTSTHRGPIRGFEGYGPTAEHARRSAEELRRQILMLEGIPA